MNPTIKTFRVFLCLFFVLTVAPEAIFAQNELREAAFLKQFERDVLKRPGAIGIYRESIKKTFHLSTKIRDSLDAILSDSISFEVLVTSVKVDLKGIKTTEYFVVKHHELPDSDYLSSFPIVNGRIVYYRDLDHLELTSSVRLADVAKLMGLK
jgi:hypothetical protein